MKRTNFIKVVIEKSDKNWTHEYYVQEDEFSRWASVKIANGWLVICKGTIVIITSEINEFPKIFKVEKENTEEIKWYK